VQFQCNICKAANEFQPTGFGRDEASCAKCGSTVRLRALLHALSVEIFGMPLALADFPPMKSIRGLGMTDQMECASLLDSRFDYRNTFYHEAPRFDVSQLPEEREIFDFILAGDVFEHVAPPVEQSLANAYALLKPHGFLAMSVPYLPVETTREHFAELHEFNLVTAGGHLALVNRTRAGVWQVFENLVFHGGHGSTLELRLFGEADLRKKLGDAGFGRVEFASAEYPPFGIVHSESWSLPVIAAKEPFHLSRDGVAELMQQHVFLKDLTQQLEAELERLRSEFEDRTRWAMELDAEVKRRAAETAKLYDELNQEKFRSASWEVSRWTHLGRALGLGPKP
jgi:SAM-dependent methyltransferase